MKENKKSKIILGFVYGAKRFFLLSMISSLIASAIELINPQIIRFTIDSIIGNEKPDVPVAVKGLFDNIGGIEFLKNNLWMIAVVVVASAALLGLFQYLAGVLNSIAAETLTATMRNSIFEKIEHLPFAWHRKNQTGDIIQRCTSDITTMRNCLTEQITSIISAVFLIFLSLFFLFEINTTIALISLFSIPIIVSYSAFFHKNIGKTFLVCEKDEGSLSAIVQENLTGVRVVRAFGREKCEVDKFQKQNNKLTNSFIKLCNLFAAFWATGDIIAGVQLMLVILIGTVLCVDSKITTGDFLAAVAYNTMMSWPVRRLGRMISEVSKAGIALERLTYIMASESEQDSPDAVDVDMTGDIEFKNVSFSFDDNVKILDDVSFKIKSGSTLGILGSTGSGKSTLTHLLCRLHELPENSGEITVSGTNIKDIKLKCLRKGVGIVLQEPFLFSRTIGENIGITKKNISQKEISRAAKIACLDDTVNEFTYGYDTIVGERGVTLSGGQKQRTAIARMLTQKAPIIIFDDSLSAVDTETDSYIRHAIKENLADSTTIIISHRAVSIMNADNIIVLDNGKILESGTHEELLKKNGAYSKIYNMQCSSDDLVPENA